MKICFVAPRLHTNQHAWIDVLEKNGHDVVFIVPGSKTLEHTRHPTYKTTPVPFKMAPRFVQICMSVISYMLGKSLRATIFRWPNYQSLYQIIETQKPDVVIVRDVASPLSLAAFWVSKRLKIKSVLYNQYPLEDEPKLHIRFFQFFNIVPKHRITPMRNDKKNFFNTTKTAYYVPLVPSFTPQPPSEVPTNEPLKLLFVGKYVLDRKRHLQAVQVVHQAIAAGADIRLTVAGGYNQYNTRIYDELVQYIQTHNLSKYITLQTTVSHYDMPKLYQAHHIFFFPSINEPFSISVLEAMAFGLVPIVSDSNGAASCIQHNKTGFILSSDMIHEYLEVLNHLVKNKEEAAQIGYNAHSYMHTNHNPDVLYKNFMHSIID